MVKTPKLGQNVTEGARGVGRWQSYAPETYFSFIYKKKG